MDLNTVSELKEKVGEVYNQLIELLPPDKQIHTQERIQATVDQMVSGEFQIVVMGEIKKGKSSFISALLGEYDLLPTDSDVATSTVYKIKYGPEQKYAVVFDSNSSEKQTEEISREQIPEYGTENGNPSNKKQVSFIQIELPNPLLEQGLVIVDTPGVGGLFKQHKGITFEYAPSADAVFFVVDSVETVINEQEIKFLKDLYKITKHVYFVQTKTDAVDTDTWQSWKERNLEIITQSEELKEFNFAKESIEYFPVSAQLKKFADEGPDSEDAAEDLEDSGFIEFNNFISNQLIGEQKLALVKNSINKLTGELEYNRGIAQENLANIKEDTEETLAEKESQLKDILGKLQIWRKTWDAVISDFTYKLSQQTKTCCLEIREELSPNKYNFTRKIESIREQYDSLSTLTNQAEEIINNHISSCAEVGADVIVQYLAKVERAFYDFTKKALNDLEQITKFGDFSISRTSMNLDNSFSYTGAAVDVAAGGVVGGAVAGGMWWAMVGGAQAAVIAGPGGGIIIGVAAAAGPLGWAAIGAVGLLGAAGAAWGTNKIREKKKITEVINLLTLEMEKVSNQSIANFDSYIEELEQDIKNGSIKIFETVGVQSKQEAEAMLVNLQEAKILSEQEADEEIKLRQAYLDKLIDLIGQLEG